MKKKFKISALFLLFLAGCAGPPLALNSDANLLPRPSSERAIAEDFFIDACDLKPLSENNRQLLRMLRFDGKSYALVNEPDPNDSALVVQRILRCQDGKWVPFHQGLLLPSDSFYDPAGLDSIRKETPIIVDLFGDLAIVNNRLLLIYYKASLSTGGDTYNSFVVSLDPKEGQWKKAFDTVGQVNLINRDGAVEGDVEPADAYFRRPQDGESVLIFKYNLYKEKKEIIGQFTTPPGEVKAAYLSGESLTFVSKKDDGLTRFLLGKQGTAQAWKIGDHTSVVPQEGSDSRILAVSHDTAFFLYDKAGRPNLGCFDLNKNSVDLLPAANEKLLLSPDQPEEFTSTLSGGRLFIASPKGLFYLDTLDPNRILFSFGNFAEVGDKTQLLLCGVDKVAGSLAIATSNEDQSMTLFFSRPR
ncbi:MAG TPA: hypothetical protein DD435_13160 [Cyanobacteria bacterium UBA8530]|nr:hypothetical protein [Cyanobacteria bacterium UBA8530]